MWIRGCCLVVFVCNLVAGCGGNLASAPIMDTTQGTRSPRVNEPYVQPPTGAAKLPTARPKYNPIIDSRKTNVVKNDVAKTDSQSSSSTTFHKVVTGDTLYSIAFQYGLDFRTLATWNDISSPYGIYVGQLIRLFAPEKPIQISKPVLVAPPLVGREKIASAPDKMKDKPIKEKLIPAEKHDETKEKTAKANSGWHWPTNGKVVQQFSGGAPGKKGIHIQGQYGQPVIAAAEGKVVYSGNGLLGYGNLIIIKHDGGFLSAYAHNSELLVKEGDHVNAGKPIAKMGTEEVSGKPVLQFEIRRDGVPTNPVPYLGKPN